MTPSRLLLLAAAAATSASAAVMMTHPAPAPGVTPLTPLLQLAFTQGRSTAPHAASPRELLGHVLAAADVSLRAEWDLLSEEAQLKAMGEASNPDMRPTQNMEDYPNPLPGPYWRWVPELLGSAVPSGAVFQFDSPCFANNTAVATPSAYGVHVVFTTGNQVGIAGCNDYYLTGTVEWINLVNAQFPNTVYPIDFPVSSSMTGSGAWVDREGVRFFRFLDSSPATTLWEAIATITLFIPALITSPPDANSVDRNLDFLARYANITFEARPPTAANLTVDPSLFQSGDLLVIHRADGLSTLETWGTGAHSSHITMFMRDLTTNDLYVVESQANGADWPTNHIQKNLWSVWLPLAIQAGYSVVWVPLSTAGRALFNVTAAWSFVEQTLGTPYGYQEFASTFYDTEFENLPWPATPQALEVVIGNVYGFDIAFNDPDFGTWNLIDLLFVQSMQFKLGQGNVNSTYIQALNAAAAQNLTFGALIAKPEQDSWEYKTGIARVCDAYYCAVMKSGGVFGALSDSVNCAEFENSAVYSFWFLDPAPVRPAACVAVDPAPYPFCQLTGNYRLTLPGVATITPYAHMMESCPSLPTEYLRTPGC